MECLAPLEVLNSKTGMIANVPCSQCLPCRIRKRDFWVTRAILECQSSIGAQFWTLTLDDESLLTFEERPGRKLYHNFLSSLRMSEKRKGNILPIRSFGCLEHGGISGRPHFHLIIFNQIYTQLEEIPYKEGLPRPRIHTPHWPHGHVDICPVNTKSLRYVSKYVSKLDQFCMTALGTEFVITPTTVENINFHPKRPALGSLGLAMHVEKISRSPARSWVQEPFIELDGKKWALPPIMLKQWRNLCRQYGLTHNQTVSDKICAKLEREANFGNLHAQQYKLKQAYTRDRIWRHTHQQNEQREFAILQRAVLSSSPAN